jgi:hypothetical protein
MVGIMKNRETLKMIMISISSVFVIIGVFAMRWNVVIGGQKYLKLKRHTYLCPGFLQPGRSPPAIIILIIPFVILLVNLYPATLERYGNVNRVTVYNVRYLLYQIIIEI